MIHFDVFHIGTVGGALRDNSNANEARKHFIFLMEDVKGFRWMEKAVVPSAAVTVEIPLRWCTTVGVPKVWVSGISRK